MRGGTYKYYFSIIFHSLLFLIRLSYYSDLILSFTDYRRDGGEELAVAKHEMADDAMIGGREHGS